MKREIKLLLPTDFLQLKKETGFQLDTIKMKEIYKDFPSKG